MRAEINMKIKKKYREHYYTPQTEQHYLEGAEMNAKAGQPNDGNEERDYGPRDGNHKKLKPHDSFKSFTV